MKRFKDLTGQKFGKLVAVSPIDGSGGVGKHKDWLCKCECGNLKTVSSAHLKDGNVTSCGCIRHNKAGLRIYTIWADMKDRCGNKKAASYVYYGGRGITVCDEWRNDFKAFYEWAMSNGYAEDLTIDRIDVNGNYEPSNCRWVTRKEQANNTRRNHFLTYDGETHTLADWAEKVGIKQNTLLYRLKRGWSVERTLSIEV